MKNINKILIAFVISAIIVGGVTAQNFVSNNLIKAFSSGTPFVTVTVEQLTTNHLPNITGTCSIGDTMNFTIKKGNTGVVSETFSKPCIVSPYSTNPTILLPDGKYRVDVSMEVGCATNNTIEGTTGNDTIVGTAGNDLINGNGGDDTMNGGLGCDTIYAGNIGNSTSGFTIMNGDGGNDTIYGGNGFNLFDGSNSTLLGVNEIDTLVGSSDIGSADYFYLASDQDSYYLTGGDSDYAEIKNLECLTDVIYLSGGPGNYTMIYSGSVTSIYQIQINWRQELIGKVDGLSSGLDPYSSCFSYLAV